MKLNIEKKSINLLDLTCEEKNLPHSIMLRILHHVLANDDGIVFGTTRLCSDFTTNEKKENLKQLASLTYYENRKVLKGENAFHSHSFTFSEVKENSNLILYVDLKNWDITVFNNFKKKVNEQLFELAEQLLKKKNVNSVNYIFYNVQIKDKFIKSNALSEKPFPQKNIVLTEAINKSFDKEKLFSNPYAVLNDDDPLYELNKIVDEKLEEMMKDYKQKEKERKYQEARENYELAEQIQFEQTNEETFNDQSSEKLDVLIKSKMTSEEMFHTVIGQKKAKESLKNSLISIRYNIRASDKPRSYLLAGPTGVGKTLLSKTFAELIGYHFINLNMTEFMDDMSLTKISGASQGYVGYGSGDSLAFDELLTHKKSVILLDELEKAHPKVRQIFMKALDEGKLQNSQNATYDFKDAIIIATTNAGVDFAEEKVVGFNPVSNEDALKKDPRNILQKTLSPEIVNRFGNIIYLDHLQQEEYAQVLDLTFAKFFENMNLPEELEPIVKQNYSTKKAELVKNYNLSFGARNSESVINDIIVQALQNY
ncbi:AAA family ATPase [Lactococcus lactis]|uniref:AAA family ATPase n=1 Tax=Lactococcus lactis TaxID=1358 RepID=UPI0028920106|nr:AAA family ATPase [Lactococcus lactis]MDT2938611.1 AAA family ATPase [Lactococcus lactis]